MKKLRKLEEMNGKTVKFTSTSEGDDSASLTINFTDDTYIEMEFSIETHAVMFSGGLDPAVSKTAGLKISK